MGESENWLDDDAPLRSDPQRGDWLSNVWLYIKSIDRRVIELEERILKLECGEESHRLTFHSAPKKLPLDED